MRKILAILLTVLIVGSLATAVFAGPSTETDTKWRVEVIYDLEEEVPGGEWEVKDGDIWTFTAEDQEGYEFEGFEILVDGEGSYEIIKQEGNHLELKVNGNLVIHVKFKDTTPEDNPDDPGPISPPTGSYLPFIAIALIIGMAGVVLSTKKLLKDR